MNRFRKSENRIDHQYVEERLSAFMDGQLSAKEVQAVRRHLASCPACRWQLNTLQQTVQWTGELPTIPVPHVFTIPASAQEKRSPRILAPRRSFVPLLQGATALIAVLLVFVVVGDVLFREFVPGTAPQPFVVVEQASQPFEPAAELQIAEMPTEEAMGMVAESLPSPAPSPMLQKMAPTEAEIAESDAEAAMAEESALTATDTDENSTLAMGAPAPPGQETGTAEETPARAATTVEEPTPMAADVAPTATSEPTTPPPMCCGGCYGSRLCH